MKRFIIALVALALASPLWAGNDKIKTTKDKVKDQYIVVLKKDVADVEATSNDLVRKVKAEKKNTFKKALKGFTAKMSLKKAEKMADDPRVAWIEEDGIVSLSATQTNATWGLDRVDQRDLPLDSTYEYTTTASGVTVYIIDTGILASHSQFGGRVRAGYSSISGGTSDCNGHGTHVAGTVGGSTYGVAKNVDLVAVRVLDCNGSGTNSGVIAGVDWVAQDHAAGTPAVANMSLGGGASSALDTAVNNAINDGITFVVASGNSNTNACNSSPARVEAAITVNSSTSTDARSSFSNYGTCTDIFAPGSSITSAWHTSTSATNTISGTSMASPHVAGAAALYLATNPSASPSAVWAAIRDTATTGKISNAGTGSPNRLLYSLLTGSGGGGGGGTPPVTELTSGQAVSNLSGAAGSFTEYFITVPSGQDSLEIQISGGSGDADLYVKYGARASTSNWDYRPYRNGNNEVVSVTSPAAGDWYIGLHGYSSYSGVTLVATYSASGGGGGGDPTCTTYTGSISGTGGSSYQPNGSYYYASSGVHEGTLSGPSNADFDLYLQRWNGWYWSTVARSESASSSEAITYSGSSGYYRWRVYSYSGSGSYSLCLDTP